MIEFQNVDHVYTPPIFKIIKGNIVNVEFEVQGDIDKYEQVPFGLKEFLSQWFYEIPNKSIKPIKLIDFQRCNNNIKFSVEFLKKSEEIDELKVLCNDILSILNYEDIRVKNWDLKLVL